MFPKPNLGLYRIKPDEIYLYGKPMGNRAKITVSVINEHEKKHITNTLFTKINPIPNVKFYNRSEE